MPKLDVVLAIPGNLEQVYQTRAKHHAIEPPAMARWIASYLLRRNCSVALIDMLGRELNFEEAAREISGLDPYLVVMMVYGSNPSASTWNMPPARKFCEKIKNLRQNLPIMMTGTHPAALPERTLREEPIDFVCDGEGPITIYDLLQVLKSNGDLGCVSGLWYWAEDRPTHTKPAFLIQNLDEEPAGITQAWELMPPPMYVAHDWHAFYQPVEARIPYANLITTLGCPFHCRFCCIQAPFKSGEAALDWKLERNSYRMWSPQLLIKEIEYLVERWSVRHIKIPDEMFLLNLRHVLILADLIYERYGDQLNFWAYGRIDTAKPQFLERLRRAGFRWLAYGIEAAESTVRDNQDKDFSDKEIVKIVRMTEEAGINVAANYIFGLPGDTRASMQKTLDLAIYLNTPFANFYWAMAIPGSQLYLDAKKKGLRLPDDPGGSGWIGYAQYSYEAWPLPTDNLTSAEILEFTDKARQIYYARPEFLEMLRNKPAFGKPAVETVVEMLSRPRIKRKLFGD